MTDEEMYRQMTDLHGADVAGRRKLVDPPATLGATGDPKREAGSRKLSYINRSLVARVLVSRVMETGAEKYGAYNWVEHPMRASTYYDAINRHMELWLDGHEKDEESDVTHLAHVIACCEILIEQQALGKLIDDRPKDMASLAGVFKELMRKKALTNED